MRSCKKFSFYYNDWFSRKGYRWLILFFSLSCGSAVNLSFLHRWTVIYWIRNNFPFLCEPIKGKKWKLFSSILQFSFSFKRRKECWGKRRLTPQHRIDYSSFKRTLRRYQAGIYSQGTFSCPHGCRLLMAVWKKVTREWLSASTRINSWSSRV